MDNPSRVMALRWVAVLCIPFVSLSAPWAMASQPPGFTYIDCGATASYPDPVTGLEWVPDAGFISTGTNLANVLNGVAEYSTLRYFDNSRAKNCYSLPVTSYSPYFLRVGFLYGSFESAPAGTLPSFQMAIDATIVANVTFTNASTAVEMEFILWSQRNVTFVCLMRDSSGSVPFISAISLRPGEPGDFLLNQASPDSSSNTPSYLRTQYRVTMTGSTAIRYPNDHYDRIWETRAAENSDLVQSTTPLQILTANQNVSLIRFTAFGSSVPPLGMMESAITTSGQINLNFDADHSYEAFMMFYFTELDPNANATSRAYDVVVPDFQNTYINIINNTLAGYVPAKPFYGDYWEFWKVPVTLPSCGISLVPITKPSGPLLSGVEFIEYVNVPVAEMDNQTAAAFDSIKSSLNLTDWSGDPCLPYAYSWVKCTEDIPPYVSEVNLSGFQLEGSIPSSFANLINLTSLLLDHNALTGPIPNLSALTKLKTLQLQNNSLSGNIPSWLGQLTQLTELFVYNNNFSGSIPQSILNDNSLNFTYEPGNPYLPHNTTMDHTSSKIRIIIGPIVGGIFVLAITMITLCFFHHRKLATIPPVEGLGRGAKAYTFVDISAATDKFKSQIGKGGFGPVYYGRFEDGQEVAVKVLDKSSHQGTSEFFNEVDVLSRVHHKNLVSLIGYCQEEGRQMLIYEYVHNGSLRDHLYGEIISTDGLDWKTRLGIALTAAQGLDYLHTGANPTMIHRDIKSSNILLTKNLAFAKVSDFGLSRLAPEESYFVTTPCVSTVVKGTAGYLDPGYFQTHILSTKSDVYSFGVVLLELLTGREPINPALVNRAEWNICEWVRDNLQEGNIDKILDPIVKVSNPNIESLWKVADIAMQSVEPKSVHRPSMSEVIQEIRLAIEIEGALPPQPPHDFHAKPTSNMSDALSGAHYDISTTIAPR